LKTEAKNFKEKTVTEPKPEKTAVLVTAPPGSRLEQLLAQYDGAKAESQDAAARFKAITTAIKAEAAEMSPGAEIIAIGGAPGLPRLRLSWRTLWHLDTDQFKEDHPYLYVKYGKQSGHWDLREQQ
jgi:hypothetical protein